MIVHHRCQVPGGGNLDLRKRAGENGRVDGVDGGCDRGAVAGDEGTCFASVGDGGGCSGGGNC